MRPTIRNEKPLLKTFLLFIFLGLTLFSRAQNNISNPALKSRIAVSITQDKTSIWISDFPKNTTIVLFDENYQMLSILSTNDFGAAFTRLPQAYNTRIYAKTLHGETMIEAIMPDKVDAKNVSVSTNNSNKS